MPGLIPDSATADVLALPRSPRLNLRGAWAVVAPLLRRKPLGAVSAVIVLVLILVASRAPVVAPRDPYEFNLNERGLPIRMHAPSVAFPLGTDPLGRDVLSRVVDGSRVSLIVGFAAVIIGTRLGTALGLISGYWEGRPDTVIQRAVDTAMSVPGIVLALAVMSVLGQSLVNIILVIALVIAPGASRVVRGTVLAVKQETFVDAAQALGASPGRGVAPPPLPDGVPPLLVIPTLWARQPPRLQGPLRLFGVGGPAPS